MIAGETFDSDYGLKLYEKYTNAKSDETRNEFLEYTYPFIRLMIAKKYYYFPNKVVTRELYTDAFNSVVIGLIKYFIDKYNPGKSNINTALRYRIDKCLWSWATEEKAMGFKSIKTVYTPVALEDETFSIKMDDDLALCLQSLLKHTPLKFYEIIVFQHLQYLIENDTPTTLKTVISEIHHRCGLSKEMIRHSLDTLYRYYYCR